MMRKVPIGLAGLGTVGCGVYKHLLGNRELLAERLGFEFDVVRVAVRDLGKARGVEVPSGLLTRDALDLVDDPGVRIVVELMGGVDRAFELVRRSVEAGKPVVTGNKALLAERGEEIFHLASERKAPVYFEAAVAGGIPIIKVLREAMVGNHIVSIHGILNGTSNYILTRMSEEGMDFRSVLEDAKRLGYAEADPTLDINGWDAAHKAIILASLAYGFWVGGDQIAVEGIERVTARDMAFAKDFGYVIKHLAVIRVDGGGEVEVQVKPTLIPRGHVLASVGGVFNAVALEGDVVGQTLYYGRGAGQDPTASSVLSDLAEAAVALDSPQPSYGFTPHGFYSRCKPVSEAVSRHYLRLSVEDKPGVMAQVARVLGEKRIGISSINQPGGDGGGELPLVLLTHEASNGRMQEALAGISALSCTKGEPTLFRVDDLES